MLIHCSLFNFTKATSDNVINEIETGFRSLGDEIPYIRSVQVGRLASDSQKIAEIAGSRGVRSLQPGFQLVVIMKFDSLDDYYRYAADEAHWALVRTLLVPHMEGRASIQFEAEGLF